ncbi:MAG: hypothetical protein RBT47_11705, partial [Anaerolineae bacterium]|nr:hypothetical protein [Anaerolineae bacterium]
SYTPFQVAQAIVHSATDLGSAGRDNAFGCGRIDAQRALAYGAVSSGCSGWSGFSVSDAESETAPALDPEAAFAPGVLLVKFDEGSVSAQHTSLLAEYNSTIAQTFDEIGVYQITVPVGEELSAAQKLSSMPGVAYVEPDYLVSISPMD